MGEQVYSKQFVVYHIKSTMEQKAYKRVHDAQRYSKKLNDQRSNFEVKCANGEVSYTYATREDYETKVVHMVERINLMSKLPYMEKSNTPNYCSPASEAYWSM